VRFDTLGAAGRFFTGFEFDKTFCFVRPDIADLTRDEPFLNDP
jgi:hypothetical protein